MKKSINRWGLVGNLSAKHITILALTIGLKFIFGLIPAFRFTKTLLFGFAFIPSAFSAAILGPVYAMVSGVAYDLLSFFLTNSGDPFFPGFTLSAAVASFIYGFAFWRKKPTWVRVSLAVLAVTVIVNLFLNTLWNSMLYGDAFIALLPPRIIKNIFSFFFNTVALYFILNVPQIQRLIRQYQF